MNLSTPRVIAVRKGRVQPGGSWLYVWIDAHTGAIVHAGGTGFDPELRAYLHVASEDPQLGHVRAAVPHFDDRDFDVLAFALPDGVNRASAKDTLLAQLTDDSRNAGESKGAKDLHDVIAPMVQAIDAHRSSRGHRPAT